MPKINNRNKTIRDNFEKNFQKHTITKIKIAMERAKIIPLKLPLIFARLIGRPEFFASGRRDRNAERKKCRPCPTQPVRGRQSGTPSKIL